MPQAQLDLFGMPITQQKTAKKAAVKTKPIVPETTEVIKSKRGRKPKINTEPPAPKIKTKRGRIAYNEVYADVVLITFPDEKQLNEKMYYSIS